MKTLLLIIILLFSYFTCLFAQEEEKKEQPRQEVPEVQELVILVNETAMFWEDMSAKDIQKIYLGKKNFHKSDRILPADRADQELHKTFLKQYVGKSEKSYKSYWVKKVYGKGGKKPRKFDDLKEFLAFIAENKGAIGFAWNTELSGKEKGIRVVKLNEMK